MRTTKILTISLMAITSLSSCELKDELSSKTPASETGMLELAVSVQQPSDNTKAATDDVNTFPVTVVNTESEEVAYSCEAYSEMESTITLPVGTYTVTAHTPGEIKTRMTAAYYSGSEQLVISDGITSQVSVECKPQNLRLRMNYSDYFKAAFTSWTITFNDGHDHTLTFTNADETTTLYWHIGDNVTTITMDVTATTPDGTTIRYQKPLTKADADNPYTNDNPNFTGGDGLDISFGVENDPVEEDKPQIVIDVTLDITFGDSNETVEIPIEDEPTTPGTGDDDEEEDEPQTPTPSGDITISDNGTGYLTNGVTVSGSDFPNDVAVVMNVKNGIKNLYVKIATTNTTFEGMVKDLGLVEGDGMDLTSAEDSGLEELFPLPESEATEYTFTMSDFLFRMLGSFPGKHDFNLTIIDQNENQASATLTININ